MNVEIFKRVFTKAGAYLADQVVAEMRKRDSKVSIEDFSLPNLQEFGDAVGDAFEDGYLNRIRTLYGDAFADFAGGDLSFEKAQTLFQTFEMWPAEAGATMTAESARRLAGNLLKYADDKDQEKKNELRPQS